MSRLQMSYSTYYTNLPHHPSLRDQYIDKAQPNPPIQIDWVRNALASLPKVNRKLLYDVNPLTGIRDALDFASVCILGGFHDVTDAILDTVFTRFPTIDFTVYLPALEFYWDENPTRRPASCPWAAWTDAQLKEAEVQERRRQTEHFKEYEGFKKRNIQDIANGFIDKELLQSLGEDLLGKSETYQGRNAMLVLMRSYPTSEGELPSREDKNRAFCAAEKLANDMPTDPGATEIPVVLHADLCVRTNNKPKAKRYLREAIGWDLMDENSAFCPITYISTRVLHKVFKEGLRLTKKHLWMLTAPVVRETADGLCKAIEERMTEGRKDPLGDVPVGALLERFTEAAWTTYEEEYKAGGIYKKDDILAPSSSRKAIRDVEERLGVTLPGDFKEFLLICNGLKGGRRFAGGGFDGICEITEFPPGSSEYRTVCRNVWLAETLRPETVSEMEARDWTGLMENHTNAKETTSPKSRKRKRANSNGDIVLCLKTGNAARHGTFTHWLVPVETYERWHKTPGWHAPEAAKEGEYRYMYTSEKLQKTALYSSIKHWLGHLVQDVEGKKQRGWRYQGREESEPLAPESESEEEEEELGEEQEEGGSNGNETSEEEFFGTYVSGVGGVWIKGMWGSDDEDEGEGEENEAEE